MTKYIDLLLTGHFNADADDVDNYVIVYDFQVDDQRKWNHHFK